MFKAVLRVLVIAVMLFAFVGQAVALNTSTSCETSGDSLSPNFSALVKHNDSNSIDTNSPEDCCGIECCGVDCTCLANVCSSIVYVNTEVDSIKITAVSEAVDMQPSEQPQSMPTLLYRPPIFSS